MKKQTESTRYGMEKQRTKKCKANKKLRESIKCNETLVLGDWNLVSLTIEREVAERRHEAGPQTLDLCI